MKSLTLDLTPEIRQILEAYVALQAQEQQLQAAKSALQEKLKSHMASVGPGKWIVEAGGAALKVVYRDSEEIEYDEPLLRSRLGERYAAILSPDIRKIRASLDRIGRFLEPALDIIGSPTRERVRRAIENGIAAREEFSGAFKRISKQSVAVMRARPDEGPDQGGEESGEKE